MELFNHDNHMHVRIPRSAAVQATRARRATAPVAPPASGRPWDFARR